ncbi:PAAR-like domain-containing protein [Agrobacterium cavarae]|uniref:PAAR-like domain-containing protein n=1 Tax=Agrobacterium cavarae TaxID=2528239 RepID=UPI0028AE3C46|nr:PAAR-like domain-containing protein [Agrobacterium cavarae]
MNDGPTILEPIIIYGSDPVANPALAQELNLPSSTLFHEPDRAAGYVDYRDSLEGDEQRAYFNNPKKGDAYHPPPTAPDPSPPEFIPDDASALAVCLSPDVCRSPEKPIPYMCWGKGDDKNNYSPNVRSNGLVIKRQNSQFHCSYGDEPGVGLGVKSGTVGEVVDPVTSSTIVRANGVPVQRHTDRCTLNNGNCPGEYVNVKSTTTTPAPDATDEEDKAWYERAWDWTGEKLSEAGQAIDEFDRNNGRVVTRTVGGLQAVGGAAEAVAGAALAGVGGAATGTGVGAAPGVPAMIGGGLLVANGYDNFQAGLRQAWTGESTPTAIAGASGDLARFAGASEQTAQQVENTVGIVQGVAGGTGAVAAGMRVAGRTAATAEAGALARTQTQTAGRTAVETGEQGARSSRYVSDADLLVTNRNGIRISKTYRRPGFRKKTKEDAWNNAKGAEGKVFDPDTGVEIKPTDRWDMGHKPGYEFWKHQESAQGRGISREQFINEYNNASHYRPELPSSNQSHRLEAPDDLYYGD